MVTNRLKTKTIESCKWNHSFMISGHFYFWPKLETKIINIFSVGIEMLVDRVSRFRGLLKPVLPWTARLAHSDLAQRLAHGPLPSMAADKRGGLGLLNHYDSLERHGMCELVQCVVTLYISLHLGMEHRLWKPHWCWGLLFLSCARYWSGVRILMRP